MSKIAQYLNEHLIGEVTNRLSIRQRYSTDGSILTMTPEVVVFPRVANDIRKVMRFTWQLAEKGHVLGVTPRGAGTNTTGAALGDGVVIDTSHYLAKTLEVNEKAKRVHVAAGASLEMVNEALKWHRLMLPGVRQHTLRGTIGGAIATATRRSATGANIADAVEQLEVVLANGDVIETARISKKEVGRKKGLQTLEGEIYRQLDGLIDDNQDLVNSLTSDRDAMGYAIDKVRGKDGSFDLTPLFVGSQGTLGIITEAVLSAELANSNRSVLIALAPSHDVARDVADQIVALRPDNLEIIDSSYIRGAAAHGKKFTALLHDSTNEQAIIYVEAHEFSDRARERKLRRIGKLLDKQNISFVHSEERPVEELAAVRDAIDTNAVLTTTSAAYLPLLDGAFVPRGRMDEFMKGLQEIADKTHSTLSTHYDVLQEIMHVRPLLSLGKVSDKQKIFKLLTQHAGLVQQVGGTIAAEQAEGRLGAFAAYSHIDSGAIELANQIRAIFDPFGTLNPGVKQAADVRTLVRSLRDEYAADDLL